MATEENAAPVSDRDRSTATEARALAAWLSHAQRLSHLGTWIWEVAGDEVRWSDELYRIYGLRPQEFGASFGGYLERVHPADRARVQSVIEEALRTGEPFDFEERIIRPDGTERVLHSRGEVAMDEGGNAVRLLGVCRDVTDSRAADANLRRSEKEAALFAQQTARLERALETIERAIGELRRSNEALVTQASEAERMQAATDRAKTQLAQVLHVVEAMLARSRLDDALSELDPHVQARVLEHISAAGQVFLTTADVSLPEVRRVAWWDVREGRVTDPILSTVRGAA